MPLMPPPSMAPSHLCPVEVEEGPRGGGPALPLIPRPVPLAAVRELGGRTEPEHAQLADLHAGPELDGERGEVGQLQGDVPAEPRVDEPGGGVGDEPEPPEGRLALEPGGQIIGQGDDLVRGGEHELPGMQDERLVPLRLHQPRQIGLLDRGVDVGVPVILEHPEVPVQPHIDAGRLHHGLVIGIDPYPSGVDLGPDVLV